MAGTTLKRVVIDNYKVFNNKQVLDFRHEPSLSTNSKYFTLVGENGSGKSTFLALVGLASDFGGKVTNHVCDQTKGSMVACEYEIENWSELTNTHTNVTCNYPALDLWFLTGVLKIPEELKQFISEKYLGLNTKALTVVIGFKHLPLLEMSDEAVVLKFLYVQSGSSIIALVHELYGEAKVAVVEGEEITDLLNWAPDDSILLSTGCNFLQDLKSPLCKKPLEFPNPKTPQASLILALRNTLTAESRDTVWADIIELFQELTGNNKITVIYDSLSGTVHMRQQYGDCETIRDDLPEGSFHAFVIAFLIVNPEAKTILLDEPTRGMHPLQIRRLQRILSQKSLQRDKVIIVATHAPDMVHTSQINQILRFQQLHSGFIEVRRTSADHDNRDIRFISSVESRELFFTRRIIWVEGDTDRRFCEAMLKLIDEGNDVLWSTLIDPLEIGEGRIPAGPRCAAEDMDDASDSSTDEIDYGKIGINPLDNLFQASAYKKRYFPSEVLADCQELARSCSVLPLSGNE
jgi:ABC-type Mn2+/Zn2+ transport system ATPase subunit